jgi:peptidoglycan hydrolase CwlO-like protein
MESAIPTTLSEWVSASFLAIIAIAVGFQVLIKNWKSNNTESALLSMMHDELERMSAQNSLLSQEVGKLQLELVKLSSQLTELNAENQKLQMQVTSLNKEIVRLHGFITTKGAV